MASKILPDTTVAVPLPSALCYTAPNYANEWVLYTASRVCEHSPDRAVIDGAAKLLDEP
jgi:hypothetical protein